MSKNHFKNLWVKIPESSILFSHHGNNLPLTVQCTLFFQKTNSPNNACSQISSNFFFGNQLLVKLSVATSIYQNHPPLVHGTLPSPYIKEPLFWGSKNQHFQQKIKALCQLQAGLATLPTASGVWRPPGHAEYWGCFLKENLRANSPRGLYNISYIYIYMYIYIYGCFQK